MKKSSVILSVLIAICLISCDESNRFANEVQIRIKNTSTYDYTDIQVNTSGGQNAYNDLIAGAASAYKTFEFAYSYAFIELLIDGVTFTIQPIDYVGETKLATGQYTYEVGAADMGGQYDRLSLHLIED